MNFVIISGLSGSGKSIALQALEDMGYYCIDNLPAVLLPQLAGELLAHEDLKGSHVAVSIDSRNRSFLQSLPANLRALADQGLDCRIVFLEADEPALIKRFSETRRRHPLTDAKVPLVEGIRKEMNLLAPLYESATSIVDTTKTTPHELRSLIRDFAGATGADGPSLLFESFGYKHGTPPEADFVFDVRCLPNPYWHDELRDLSGLDRPVVEFLEADASVGRMIEEIRGFLETWLPSFEAQNRSYITVAIGCTGGRHRSVYVTERLTEHFGSRDFPVQARHRSLP